MPMEKHKRFRDGVQIKSELCHTVCIRVRGNLLVLSPAFSYIAIAAFTISVISSIPIISVISIIPIISVISIIFITISLIWCCNSVNHSFNSCWHQSISSVAVILVNFPVMVPASGIRVDHYDVIESTQYIVTTIFTKSFGWSTTTMKCEVNWAFHLRLRTSIWYV